MSTDDLKDGGFRKDDFASQEDIPPIPEALPVLPVQDAVTIVQGGDRSVTAFTNIPG